jgi:hypothetical protein
VGRYTLQAENTLSSVLRGQSTRGEEILDTGHPRVPHGPRGELLEGLPSRIKKQSQFMYWEVHAIVSAVFDV